MGQNPDQSAMPRAARQSVFARTAGSGRLSGLRSEAPPWPAVAGWLLSWCLGVSAVASQSGAPPKAPPHVPTPQARPGPPPAPPLSDLDRALLEGLPAIAPATDAPRTPQVPAQSPARPDTLPSKPSPGAASPATLDLAALRPIAQQMLDVTISLEKLDTSPRTQGQQAQIIDRLRQLVGTDGPTPPPSSQAPSAGSTAAAEAASASGPAQAAEPAGAIGQARGTAAASQVAGPPALHPQQVAPLLWGHLPEKLREEMLSALGESFVPKYERLIEQYYRRLAEQPPSRP